MPERSATFGAAAIPICKCKRCVNPIMKEFLVKKSQQETSNNTRASGTYRYHQPERGHSCPQQFPIIQTLGKIENPWACGSCCGQECPRSGWWYRSAVPARAYRIGLKLQRAILIALLFVRSACLLAQAPVTPPLEPAQPLQPGAENIRGIIILPSDKEINRAGVTAVACGGQRTGISSPSRLSAPA